MVSSEISEKNAKANAKTAIGNPFIRRKLHVYTNAKHPHIAQQPTVLNLQKRETK